MAAPARLTSLSARSFHSSASSLVDRYSSVESDHEDHQSDHSRHSPALSPSSASACSTTGPMCPFPLFRRHLLFYKRTKYLLLKMQTGECIWIAIHRSSLANLWTISRDSLPLICR